MANREEALRRIFEATGVDARLTDDQKKELLTHLEDAVQAKVNAGVAEMEAVGQAFVELGNLEKIARQFPAPKPVAVTPEGVSVLPDARAVAGMALGFLAFFAVLGWFVTPKFGAIFNQVKVPMPLFTLIFVKFGDLLRSTPFVPAIALLLLVGTFLAFRRRRVPPAVAYVLLLLSAGLCLGLVVGLFLPLLSLLEGIGLSR